MKNLITLILILFTYTVFGQVKVGDNPNTINANSILELESTNKGLLLPRMALTSTAAASPMSAHTAGMLVYNTATVGDVVPGYYYNDGSKWVQIADASSGDGDAWGVSNEDIASDISRTGNVKIENANSDVFTIRTTDNAASQGIAFQNSGNNYTWSIFREDAGSSEADLVFSGLNNASLTGLAERMRIKYSGEVGIGTDSPSTRFHLNNGTALIQNSSAGNGLLQFDSDGATTDAISDYASIAGLSGGLSLSGLATGTAANSHLFVRNDGNIGIGNTDPSETLVLGADAIQLSDANNVGSTADIRFLAQGLVTSESNTIFGIDALDATTNSSFLFIKDSEGTSGSAEIMRIQENGNVGIGINNPSELLHVDGNTRTDDLYALDNVGIGTATPSAPLDIAVTSETAIEFDNGGNIITIHDGFGNFNIKSGVDDDNIITGVAGGSHIRLDENGYISLALDESTAAGGSFATGMLFEMNNDEFNLSGGNVGINDGTPTFRLELPNTGTDAGGRGRANAWATYSDERVKSDVKTISYGLNTVMNLEPKSYFQHNSTSDSTGVTIKDSGEENIGFIAQELDKVVPEAVFKPEDENTTLWSVDYTRLIPVLTRAIQEQQEQIEQLKKEIEELKKDN